VDDESWIDLERERGTEDDLDGVLPKFQSFLVQPSHPKRDESSPSHPPTTELEILRPRIISFLIWLHAVLKGPQEMVYPTKGPFASSCKLARHEGGKRRGITDRVRVNFYPL
jgi:hypothetical protein